jgi:hypothetical protein
VDTVELDLRLRDFGILITLFQISKPVVASSFTSLGCSVNQISGHAKRRRFFEILRFWEHTLILPALADRGIPLPRVRRQLSTSRLNKKRASFVSSEN